MKRAERQRVRHDVRPARSVPLDVGGLEADGLVVQANGEAADGASVAVGFEDLLGEARVSGPSPRGDVRGFDAGGMEDFAPQRYRKVGVDERVGDLFRQVLVGAQRRVDGFGITRRGRCARGRERRCASPFDVVVTKCGALDLP